MVVIVIIAVIASWFFLNVNLAGADRHLRVEAERLQALLYLAAEEAALYGREYGLEVTDEGYEFALLNQDTQQWETPTDMRTLRPRSLPEGMTIELSLENTDVILETEKTKEDEHLPHPQIFVLSSGELTPFELRLDSEFTDSYVEIVGLVNGAIESRWSDFEY